MRIQPDGVGRVAFDRGQVWFFFELDRGTEQHRQLRGKLRHYVELTLLNDVPHIVLFAFPTERREAEVRKDLFASGLTVATTVLEQSMADPLGPVWRPLGHPFRLPLEQLPMVSPQRPAP